MIRPRARSTGVLTTLVGNELVVDDQDRQRRHRLNQAAAVVWHHCDGRHTLEELRVHVSRELGIAADESVVLLALAELDRAHLLVEPNPIRDILARMSRRTLFKAAAAVAAAELLPSVASAASVRAQPDDGSQRSPIWADAIEVGVMLPAYLETRFDPPNDTRPIWQLRVRIVPDEAFIDRHNPLASSEEIASIERLWQSAPNGLPDLDADPGAAAWQAFVDRNGGARAAWLARSFPPLPPDAEGVIHVDPPDEFHNRLQPHFSAMWAVPDRLEIWLARGGNPPQFAEATTVNADELHFDTLPDLEDPTDERWWTSWKHAVEVAGLGVIVPLEETEPTDIEAVYVIGLSEHDPATLFQAHRDSGNLAVIQYGAPTNTVDGEPAIPLAFDAATWLNQARAGDGPPDIGSASGAVGRALTGDGGRLGALAGDDFLDHDPLFLHDAPGWAMMTALWPVLWGHALKDIWGLGEPAQDGGVWASAHVRPTGPYPSIRIGSQPYGLLPTTSLETWLPSDTETTWDAIEAGLQPSLITAMSAWQSVAEADTAGTVANADTTKLLRLLGHTPTSNAYAHRSFLPLHLLQVFYAAYADEPDFPQLNLWWDDTAIKVLSEFPVSPLRKYVTLGWLQDLILDAGGELPRPLPLVAPMAPADEEGVDEQMTFGDWLDVVLTETGVGDRNSVLTAEVERWFGWSEQGQIPGSLLLRLLFHARWVTGANLLRESEGNFSPLLEPVAFSHPNPGIAMSTVLFNETKAWEALSPADQAAASASGTSTAALFLLVQEAIKALFDIPVGILDRVMRATLDTASHRIDPWVTAYAFRRLEEGGQGQPFRLGLYGWVDAPQPAKLGSPQAPGPTKGGLLHAPSDQQILTSVILRDKAISEPESDRWAMSLASDSIRTADEIAAEVRLGSHLSEVLGRRIERIVREFATIKELRTSFPMRTEHGGRRVCNGIQILELLATAPDTPPFNELDTDQKAALTLLQRAIDAYGDLLVAEAVHHVTAGRGTVAGAAMDAAAGLAGPPNLEVISTLRSGRAVTTNVVVMLPAPVDPALTFDTSPGLVADPAVANFLDDQLGTPSDVRWRWQVAHPDGIRDVALADVGLTAIDTVMLSEEELLRQVLAGVPGGSWVGDPSEQAGSESQQSARQLVELLGSQPALPEDLVVDDSDPGDDAVRAELRNRLHRLFQVGAMLRDALQSPDDAQALLALRAALRWGITPLPLADDTVQARAQRAREALIERLTRAAGAVQPAESETEIDAETATDLPIGEEHLAHVVATTIAELAAPEGQIAVLSRIDLADVQSTFDEDVELDQDWLAVVAAVRPALARLEVHQMEANEMLGQRWPQFSRWSSHPGDPWHTWVLNHSPGEGDEIPAARFVAVYGPPGVFDANATMQVAAGLLDSWGETIPAVSQATSAAFGFNAPAARAPQAILLAVPPVTSEPLTPETLIGIVAETRQLARARVATADDLSALAAALPLTMLPAAGATAVRLTT